MKRLILCAVVVLLGVGQAEAALIYFTEISGGRGQPASIMRVNGDGSDLTTLLSTHSEFRGMAVDPQGGMLYWTSPGTLDINSGV